MKIDTLQLKISREWMLIIFFVLIKLLMLIKLINGKSKEPILIPEFYYERMGVD